MEPYEQLEREFRDYVEWGYPVACNSGTAALHLALEALELPLGSQVLVPEFTMVACARAVVMAGLKPVFVDCDDNGLMDFDKIHQYITPSTKAIMPVHVYGRSIPRSVINSLGDIKVVEDWAEHTKPVWYEDKFRTVSNNEGIHSRALCWSFYKNKIIHGEEGGMVLFKNKRDAELAKSLRCQGFTDQHDFKHYARGHNYRITNNSAQLICHSLGYIDQNLNMRRAMEAAYDSVIPISLRRPPREVPWVYDVWLDHRQNADKVVATLNSQGIAARHSFKPMSMQQEFVGHWSHLNAYKLSQRMIYLPLSENMTTQDAIGIAQAFLACQ